LDNSASEMVLANDSCSHARRANSDALERKITAAIRAGQLPPETDPRTLAIFYMATLQGMSAQARDGATRTDMEHIATMALKG
jgi:hypothetical protein